MPGSDRQINLDLLARDKSGPAVKSFSDNLDDAADSADDAAKATDGLGKASDKTGSRVKLLDREIGLLEHELRGLHEAFADTSDAAERMDISKVVRKMQADLKRATQSRDALKGLLPDPEPEGRSFAGKLANGITDGISGISGKLGAAVGPTIGASVGAAAAPILLGTIATVLAAGAGAGVIGAGVMAAVKGDPQIQAAGKLAGANFTGGLKGIAVKELKGPILDALADLSEAGERVNKKLGGAFDKLAPRIRPFTKDIIAAGEAVSGALIDEASDAGPALDGLGDSVRIVGDGVADFVRIVADGGPEAASNLRLIAGVTADLLRQTGFMIRAFNELGNNPWITGPLLPLLRKHYDDAAKGQKDLAGGAPAAIDGIGLIGGAAEEAAPKIQSAADAIKEFTNNNQDLFDSTTSVAAALDKTAESIKKNGRTLDENTEKGRNNREALSNLATQLNRNYEASLKVNGEGPKTDAVARSNTRHFVDMASKMTGSRRQAIELANKLLAIPNVQRTVTINGLSAAQTVARRIKETLRAIKDEHVNVIYDSGQSSSALRAAYNKNAREYGGPVKAGHAYVVGEKRPEVFVPDRDGRIVPSVEQYARAGYGGGSSWMRGATQAAPRAQAFRLAVSPSADSKVAELINYLIRNGDIALVPG
ncbi:hypothetical protein AB0M54_24295 [Actinoplanes sp. NPDC051470]|uniref:hypothetical protein n=1 Tax=Actinoplanes sp. NPDC051470 TaxID=3157224 RepID=UPI00342A9305